MSELVELVRTVMIVSVASVVWALPCALFERNVLRLPVVWWKWLIPVVNLFYAGKIGRLPFFRFLIGVVLLTGGWNLMLLTFQGGFILFDLGRLAGLWITFAALVYSVVVLSEWYRNVGWLVGRPCFVLLTGWLLPAVLALLSIVLSVFGIIPLEAVIYAAGIAAIYCWSFLVWLAYTAR